jgi:hypothetical protein
VGASVHRIVRTDDVGIGPALHGDVIGEELQRHPPGDAQRAETFVDPRHGADEATPGAPGWNPESAASCSSVSTPSRRWSPIIQVG